MSDAAQPNEQDDSASILIAVIRTGGVAGIRRRWYVEPPQEEEPRWIELIDLCPWDDTDPAPAEKAEQAPEPEPGPEPSPTYQGADRYVWSIQARTPEARRERDLPDSALDGPWRRLVDAVRAAAAS